VARGPKYKVPKRRRREGKTDYYKRYRLVSSGHHIYIVRKTNRYVLVQVVKPSVKGDLTIAAAHSMELVKKYGWRGGTKNVPAAYLTGLLASLRALRAGIKYAAPYIGLHKPTRGAKVFAAIKAANDVGLKVPVSNEVVPSENRLRGEHIAAYAKALKETNPDLYFKRFSLYLAKGFEPILLPEHFDEVRSKVISDYSDVVGGGG